MATSDRDTFFNYLTAEYQRPFNGWDFSYLNGRRVDMHQHHRWDYAQIVTSAMKEAQSMLDMRTGGGERLAHYLNMQPVPDVCFRYYKSGHLAQNCYHKNLARARKNVKIKSCQSFRGRPERPASSAASPAVSSVQNTGGGLIFRVTVRRDTPFSCWI